MSRSTQAHVPRPVATDSTDLVIELSKVVKRYTMGDIVVEALRGVSLGIGRRDFVAIMGTSGSGKSTLMNIIGCLDFPTSGLFHLDGVDVRLLDEARLSIVRSRKIGFVFQSFNLIPRTSAVANVELPLVYAGVGARERRRRAVAALESVGLGGRLDHMPSELSGGQQQRCAVARAIVTNPAIVLADEPTGNLDSASSDEVMGIFSRLNAEGRTVVMITHENDVASFAKRVVRLRDGMILDDRRIVRIEDGPPGLEERRPPSRGAGAGHPRERPLGRRIAQRGESVRIGDSLRIAFGGIASNKLRSALTVLGVLIGVGAVIILIGVGTGTSRAVEAQINQLGTNTLTVFNTGRFGSGTASSGTQSRAATLTITDVQKIANANDAPDVASVSPVVTSSVTASYGAASYSTTVLGSTPSYLQAEDYKVATGSSITAAEVRNHSRVVVIGSAVASSLFAQGTDPIGQTIYLASAQFQVVGVLQSKGSTGLQNADAVAIAPYTAVEDELTGYSQSFSQLIVQGKSAATISLAESEVQSILAAANDTTVANLPFNVLNQASLVSAATSSSSQLTVLLGIVAGISLLVGGIGVMNIMLVSVTERTREIGIRKAIGAPKIAILTQFLTEAVLLSLVGGLAGVAAGLVGTRFKIEGVYPVIDLASIVLAFGVAIAVGIFFGFYPANRAASLRPIDALRYE